MLTSNMNDQNNKDENYKEIHLRTVLQNNKTIVAT